MEITFWDSNDEEVTLEVPSKWAICSCCEGNGRMENPAFSNGISGEEWNNEWEDEEREAYLSGAYDVRCDDCNGTGKVRVADLSVLSDEERQEYRAWLKRDAEFRREQEAERRWGF
jgi:RecJ-like exonuclease